MFICVLIILIDENFNVSSECVSIEDYDLFVIDWNINSYCNFSNGLVIE